MPTPSTILKIYQRHEAHIDAIAREAAAAHAAVNQYYGGNLPYSYHLRLTANYALRFAHLLPLAEEDMETVFAAAWFHDALEDARLTYNDVTKIFEKLNAECGCSIRAHDASEIVYALTNDKGRTRAERAGERYYAGIRQTPFAPYLKMCDRLANLRHSTLFYPCQRMAEVYAREMPHFLESIGPVPEAMVRHAEELLAEV